MSVPALPPTSPMQWRTLLCLLAAVLLAHGVLLSGAATTWSVPSVTSLAMQTRTVQPQAEPAPPVPAAPAPEPAKPAAAPKPPKNIPNSPPAQENKAQTATEIVASQLPPTEAANPPEPSEPAVASSGVSQQNPPADRRASASATPAALEPAPAPRPTDFAFAPTGRYDYNVLQTSGSTSRAASGSLQWASDGTNYQLALDVKLGLLFTVLKQTSVGKLSAAGLEPERFTHKSGTGSERATHFEQDKGRISFSSNKPDAAWQSGAQDRLSILMQISGMLAGNVQAMQAQGSITLPVAGVDGSEPWQFVIEGEETLTLPAGITNAIHLVRYPRKEFDRRVELWVSPVLSYLPVRVKQTEQNGDVFELLLSNPVLP